MTDGSTTDADSRDESSHADFLNALKLLRADFNPKQQNARGDAWSVVTSAIEKDMILLAKRKLPSDPDEAEQTVFDVREALWSRLTLGNEKERLPLQSPLSFRAYFAKCVLNRCVDTLRRQQRAREFALRDDPDDYVTAHHSELPLPQQEWTTEYLVERLRQAGIRIDDLDKRILIELSGGKSYRLIGQATSVDPNAVAQRIFRIRLRVRNWLHSNDLADLFPE